MFSMQTTLLGVALALDAAAMSFALGLLSLPFSRNEKIKRGAAVALVFGFFQFLMLWLGSIGGHLISFSSIGHLFHFIVAGIFLLIGIKVIQESMNEEIRELKWGLVPVMGLALITSIDALASGFSFGTLPGFRTEAVEVGVITFIVCGIFYLLSQFFQRIPERTMLRLAGGIFLFLSGQTLWKYFV